MHLAYKIADTFSHEYVCHNYKKTVVLVTHNAKIAETADRVIHIQDGKIESDEMVSSPVDPETVQW